MLRIGKICLCALGLALGLVLCGRWALLIVPVLLWEAVRKEHYEQLCIGVLAVSFLLTGCGPVVSPKDPEFRDAMREAIEDLDSEAEDWAEDWEASAEDWAEDWEAAIDAWAERWDGEGTADGKEHRWEIQDGGGKVLYSVTKEEGVEALDALFNEDGKDWSRLSEEVDGEPLYSYVYCQEKTRLAGQDPEEARDYEALMSFSVFEDGAVVKMAVLKGADEIPGIYGGSILADFLTFYVEAPEETAEALRDPAQFAD